MITRIALDNYKCHKRLDLPLSRLSVFCGKNGAGKSSTIQALLLLSGICSETKELNINNKFISLGRFEDILNKFSDIEEITFSLTVNAKEHSISAKGIKSKPDKIKIINKQGGVKTSEFLNFSGLHYISAERISPLNIYPVSNNKDRNMDIGARGQYVFEFLSSYGLNDCVLNNINDESFINKEERKIKTLVSKWLGFVTESVSFDVNELSDIDQVNARFKFDNEPGVSHRPINVGFGITYALPVIVALIKSQPGDLLLIENPESHLHPYGQRKLGELISRVAAAGVQIILETHSDHIINGIRIATKNMLVANEDVRIFHFDKSIKENKESNFFVKSINVDEYGKLSDWPRNFFDEYENALTKLF